MDSIRQFLASTATSRWLPVKWRHFPVTSNHLRSCDVISCHVTASSCELQIGRKSNGQYMPGFGRLQPVPGDFRSNNFTSKSLPVTWGHVTSYPVTWLPLPASYSLAGSQTHSIARFRSSTATSMWLPLKWRHFRVTSGHLRLCDVISCHVTASSCELQPCRKSYAQYTQVFSLLQQLPGDFRSNDVTSGHLKSLTSFPVTWLPPPASYSLVGSQTHSIRKFSAFYSHFQVTSGQMTSLPVTWGHVTSFPVTWLPPLASYIPVESQTHSIRQFSAFYSDL